MALETQEKVDRVTEWFRELSRLTPDAIYERVKAAGLKGEAGNSYRCPLAVLAEHELGFKVVITSSTWRLEFGEYPVRNDILPASCCEFVLIVDGDESSRYADILY